MGTTLGYTTSGTSSDDWAQYFTGYRVLATEDGVIQKMSVYARSTDLSTFHVHMGLYSDQNVSGHDYPHELISGDNVGPAISSDSWAWYDSAVLNGEIKAGTYYWICLNVPETGAAHKIAHDAGGDCHYASGYSGNLPTHLDPLGSWLDRQLSLYVTYTPGKVLGNIIPGANRRTTNSSYIIASKFTAPEAGVVKSISLYCENLNGQDNDVAFCLYQDGSPMVLLATTGPGDVPAYDSPGWVTLNVISGGDFSAGDHWIGFNSNNGGILYYGDTGTLQEYESADWNGTRFPSTILAWDGSWYGDTMSIYVLYDLISGVIAHDSVIVKMNW